MYKYSNKSHTSVTNLETGESGIHQGSLLWHDYEEWALNGGLTEPFQSKKELLISELQSVDAEVQSSLKSPFQFNGNNYYPDTEFIQGMFSAL